MQYVESNLNEPINLGSVAGAVGSSQYHLTRSFGLRMGMPLIRYVRMRRLTHAAKALAAGNDNVLTIALEAQYASEEAFIRAFRKAFGVTPGSVRRSGDLSNLSLLARAQPIKGDFIELSTPRRITREAFHLSGIGGSFGYDSFDEIGDLWRKFFTLPTLEPTAVDTSRYGAAFDCGDGAYSYLAGIETISRPDLPEDLTYLEVPECTYIVFEHHGQISGLKATLNTIWELYFTTSGHRPCNGVELEVYGERFNPVSDESVMEIWIPVDR